MNLQPSRPAHRPSRRSELLSAALEVFATTEWSTVSIEVIAKRAQMTTAAVYYHFGSKTEIIETLSSGVADKVAHFFSLPTESIRSPAEWGTASVMETLRWMVTDPLEAKFFFVRLAMTHDGAESLGQFRRDTGRLVEFIANSITALDGAIADVEAAVMARALLALVAETARTTLTNRNTAPQNFLQYQQAAAIIASRILTR